MKFHVTRLNIVALILAFVFFSSTWAAAAHESHEPAQAANTNPLAQAAENVQFIRNQFEVDFPNTLTFSVNAKADEEIISIALEYGTNAASCVRSVARQTVEIEPGQEVEGEWIWDFIDSGSLPMGAQVWWEWEARLASGSVARSQRQTQTIVDQRYSWEQTGSDPADITSVNVWYHDTSASFAKDLAAIGQQALQTTQAEFGVTPATQVAFILYNSSDEVYESGLFLSEWVGAYALPEYNLVVLGIEQGDYTWGEEVIHHELGHLISGELTANCLAVSLPTWLSEGFSMYAEGGVDPSEQSTVKNALTAGTLPPLRTLAAGFAAGDADARLSYAQSGMVVEFMVKEYGAEKLPQLFAAIQGGILAEDGLRQVYNLDVDSLDNAWRTSLGFVAQAAPLTPTATPLPSSVPTQELFAPFDATAIPPTAVAAVPTPTHPLPPAEILASPSPTSSSGEPATPPNPGGTALPCLGGNAMLLGLFLALLLPVYRRK